MLVDSPLSKALPARASSMVRAAFLSSLAALCGAIACDAIPVDDTTFQPQGVLEGTLVYTGPLPCVQHNHILGSALLLVFNADQLPPPDGFGTTAAQLGVVTADELFASVSEQLPANPGDGVVCPKSDAQVTVSASWKVGPLPAGRWQVRAFFDHDGDFSPILKTHNLPTAGDIGGGAIANAAEVLAGQPVRYQAIELGVPDPSGKLVMPPSGARVSGIAVTLGQPLALPRPIFHFKSVLDERPVTYEGQSGTVTAPPLQLNTDPAQVVMSRDERFLLSPTAHVEKADQQFIRLVLGASLPGGECAQDPSGERCLASQSPFWFQTVEPYAHLYVYGGLDRDGEIAATPEKAPITIPSLFPQAIFGRLDPTSDPYQQTAQGSPAVILQGLVLHEGTALKTTTNNFFDSKGKPLAPKQTDELTVALRPSVICLNPLDVDAPVYVVTPSFKALNGEEIIDPADIAPKVRKQLGNRPNIQVIEGCLPEGQYQANLVYDTGQAWTVPNEAGTCLGPNEVETAPGSGVCRQGALSRPVLHSQLVTFKIEGERESGFCAQRFSDPNLYVNGVPKVCLRADEGGEAPTAVP